MKILLDTHILLWALIDDPRLDNKSRILIDDPENLIYYSAASIWEIAIKHNKNPELIPFGPEDVIRYCDYAGFLNLPVNLWHASEVYKLKVKNGNTVPNDPFDRMLVSQAKTEGMPFLTHDSKMWYYDEPCIIMCD